MADIFDVIADPTRRDILQTLLGQYETRESGEISVSEIVARLGVSQPTISKHLRVLRDAGLVSVREEGQHRFYRLDQAPLEYIEDWLIPFLTRIPDDGHVFGIADALTDNSRAFAAKLGKAVADRTHQMASVVGPKRRRRA